MTTDANPRAPSAPQPTTGPLHLPGTAWAALGYVAAVAAAVGVFMMYLQPHFLRDLADQIWACF